MTPNKAASNTISRQEANGCSLEIVSQDKDGNYVVTLPPALKDYQEELESLLEKVFSGRTTSSDNLDLARQMSLNWCMAKCREIDLSYE